MGLWTAAVGLTQNFGQLLTIRAISGIGLGCLMPATFSIMSDTFPPKDRGKSLGIMEATGHFRDHRRDHRPGFPGQP